MKSSLALLAILCAALVIPSLSRAQVYNSGGPMVNNMGQPIAGNVAVCTTKPAGTNPPDCTTFAQTYTDATLSTTCTLNPATLGPISGTGCTNPGKSDSRGNVTYYAGYTAPWNEYYGYGFNTYVAQTAAPGLANVTMTPPATWVGVTAATRSDSERHSLGSIPLSIEDAGSFIQGGVYLMDVPSTATSTPNNNYNALATYGRSASAVDGIVGLFSQAWSGATSVQEWSANFSVNNCDGTTVGCSNGHGYGNGNLIGLEQDVNLYTSATSTVPANVDGIDITGGSLTQSATTLNALHIRPVGIFGCPGNTSVCIPWFVGLNMDDGAATTGIQLGTNQTGNSQQSMPINLIGRDSGGTARTSSILNDQFGNLTFTTAGGNGLQVTVTGKTMVNLGVSGDGGGMKHKRVSGCTTAASANATCSTSVAWTTAFADASYTTTATLDAPTVSNGCNVLSTNTKIAASLNVVIQNSPGSSSACTGTIDIIAIHD